MPAIMLPSIPDAVISAHYHTHTPWSCWSSKWLKLLNAYNYIHPDNALAKYMHRLCSTTIKYVACTRGYEGIFANVVGEQAQKQEEWRGILKANCCTATYWLNTWLRIYRGLDPHWPLIRLGALLGWGWSTLHQSSSHARHRSNTQW